MSQTSSFRRLIYGFHNVEVVVRTQKNKTSLFLRKTDNLPRHLKIKLKIL